MNTVEFNSRLKKMKFDKKSFNWIYAHCYNILKIRIETKFKKPKFTEDVIQDIFNYLMYRYNPTDFVKLPFIWLCTAADNRAISRLKMKSENLEELNENIPYQVYFEEDDLVFTKEGFKDKWYKLDDRSRDILIMHDILGYKYKEIAILLEMSYSNVRVKASRAKSKIKKLWLQLK